MRLFTLPLALSLSACHDPGIVIGELHDTIVLKAIPNRDLDLLFVIDDSPSMLDAQAALADAFPRMIDVLEQLDGGLPNLHIGVVTSDMGTSSSTEAPGPAIGSIGQGGCANHGKDGALQTGAIGVPFLVDLDLGDGTRERNYTGALRDVFGDIARVGASGCGFEQHLAAMSRAFTNPANTGFLRPEANLAVVILADEDDCSAHSADLFAPDSGIAGPLQSFRCFQHGVTCSEPTDTIGPKSDCHPTQTTYVDDVAPFIDDLVALKGDERAVMVGVIAGAPSSVAVELATPPGGGTPIPTLAHACTIEYPTGPSSADPAVRLAAFTDGFPGRATFTSVCSADLSAPLHQIGSSAKALMGDPCLDSARLADVSPSEPGVQPSCEVVDIADHAPTAKSSLAACSSGAPDCYEIVADETACPATADHLRVRVARASSVTPDTWTYVRCKRSE